MAEQTSWLYMGATGTLVEPLRFLPIIANNLEELRRKRNELADRKIDQVFGESE